MAHLINLLSSAFVDSQGRILVAHAFAWCPDLNEELVLCHLQHEKGVNVVLTKKEVRKCLEAQQLQPNERQDAPLWAPGSHDPSPPGPDTMKYIEKAKTAKATSPAPRPNFFKDPQNKAYFQLIDISLRMACLASLRGMVVALHKLVLFLREKRQDTSGKTHPLDIVWVFPKNGMYSSEATITFRTVFLRVCTILCLRIFYPRCHDIAIITKFYQLKQLLINAPLSSWLDRAGNTPNLPAPFFQGFLRNDGGSKPPTNLIWWDPESIALIKMIASASQFPVEAQFPEILHNMPPTFLTNTTEKLRRYIPVATLACTSRVMHEILGFSSTESQIKVSNQSDPIDIDSCFIAAGSIDDPESNGGDDDGDGASVVGDPKVYEWKDSGSDARITTAAEKRAGKKNGVEAVPDTSALLYYAHSSKAFENATSLSEQASMDTVGQASIISSHGAKFPTGAVGAGEVVWAPPSKETAPEVEESVVVRGVVMAASKAPISKATKSTSKAKAKSGGGSTGSRSSSSAVGTQPELSPAKVLSMLEALEEVPTYPIPFVGHKPTYARDFSNTQEKALCAFIKHRRMLNAGLHNTSKSNDWRVKGCLRCTAFMRCGEKSVVCDQCHRPAHQACVPSLEQQARVIHYGDIKYTYVCSDCCRRNTLVNSSLHGIQPAASTTAFASTISSGGGSDPEMLVMAPRSLLDAAIIALCVLLEENQQRSTPRTTFLLHEELWTRVVSLWQDIQPQKEYRDWSINASADAGNHGDSDDDNMQVDIPSSTATTTITTSTGSALNPDSVKATFKALIVMHPAFEALGADLHAVRFRPEFAKEVMQCLPSRY